MPSDKNTAKYINDLNAEPKERVSALLDVEQDRLDVVLKEDAWNGLLADLVALLRNGVLVGDNGAARG